MIKAPSAFSLANPCLGLDSHRFDVGLSLHYVLQIEHDSLALLAADLPPHKSIDLELREVVDEVVQVGLHAQVLDGALRHVREPVRGLEVLGEDDHRLFLALSCVLVLKDYKGHCMAVRGASSDAAADHNNLVILAIEKLPSMMSSLSTFTRPSMRSYLAMLYML